MTLKNTRKLHCSFCGEEGHSIYNCPDPQIEYLLKEFQELVAVDWKCNLKTKYLKFIINSYSIPELRVIGYTYDITMNKKSKQFFISEIINCAYSDTEQNNIIIQCMNNDELIYYSKKIVNNSPEWNNNRKCSLQRIQQLLGVIQINPKKKNNVKNSNDNITFEFDDSIQDNDCDINEENEEEYNDIFYPFFNSEEYKTTPVYILHVFLYIYAIMLSFAGIVSNYANN